MIEGKQGGGKKEARVVIVDQNQNSMTASRQALTDAGFTIDIAVDGLDALGLIVENIPEFVLIDRACSELDGFQVAALLSSREDTESIKVILITEKSSAFDRLKAEALGIKELLIRPFGRLELLEALGCSNGESIEKLVAGPRKLNQERSKSVKQHNVAEVST